MLEVIRPERNPLFGELGLAQAISQANNQLRLKPVNIGEMKAALKEGAERWPIAEQYPECRAEPIARVA